MLTICFDIDETIFHIENRNYDDPQPIWDTILYIRQLKQKGHKIILLTSRGMVSMKGDIKKIKATHEMRLLQQLGSYAVPFDELHFGKPIADAYYDDKSVPMSEMIYEEFSGKSGDKVTRIGNIVIKEGSRVAPQVEWYKQYGKYYNTPKIYSYTLGKLYMEYVEGPLLINMPVRELCASDIIQRFDAPTINVENTNWKEYAEYINELAMPYGLTDLGQDYQYYEWAARYCHTHCHGDASITNIILCDDSIGDITSYKWYFIDPSYKPTMWTSKLLDLTKLIMSFLYQGTETHKLFGYQLLSLAVNVYPAKFIYFLVASHLIRCARDLTNEKQLYFIEEAKKWLEK